LPWKRTGSSACDDLEWRITAFEPNGNYEHFPAPDAVTTNIVFGGADMRDAWITCSSTGKLYQCRWPRPGLKLPFNA